MKKKEITEHQIEAEILWKLYKQGYEPTKLASAGFFDGKLMRAHTNPFTRRGVSDIFFLIEKCVFIEVKRPKELAFIKKHYERMKTYKGPTKKYHHIREQIEFVELVKKRGHIAFFASSWADVVRELSPWISLTP